MDTDKTDSAKATEHPGQSYGTGFPGRNVLQGVLLLRLDKTLEWVEGCQSGEPEKIQKRWTF